MQVARSIIHLICDLYLFCPFFLVRVCLFDCPVTSDRLTLTHQQQLMSLFVDDCRPFLTNGLKARRILMAAENKVNSDKMKKKYTSETQTDTHTQVSQNEINNNK